MSSVINILCIGDVIGSTGLSLFSKHIANIKKEFAIDIVVVNGENSAPTGRGITVNTANALIAAGAAMITGGNHSFDQREIYEKYSDINFPVLRPANFPSGCPGRGVGFITLPTGQKIAVINIQGRVFSRQNLDCPFRTLESLLTFVQSQTRIILVDFHAEATSEKAGFAYSADGKVSLVFGTHTHVQTSDERILPQGTAFITDIGMVGSFNSMIGMKKEAIIHNMKTQLPVKFEVDSEPPFILNGIIVQIDITTGRTVSINRVAKIYSSL